MQLGPAPSPQTTSGGAVLQHSLLERGFRKQYVASNISDMILYTAIAVSIVILLARMQDAQTIKWQIVALPVGLGGLAAVIIQTMYRVRNRGALPTISTRCDFAIIFIYLAAYKLDGEQSLSWTIIFIFLFWWIIAFVLLGLAGLVLYHAGRRARVWSATDLRVRLSVALMHVSYILLLIAAGFLFQFFNPNNGNAKLTERRGARLFTVCLSLTAAWIILSSAAWVFVYLGQRKREIEREAQISRGHVWTELANISNEMATVVRQVDALTPEEIIRKAGEMMIGVTKPDRLYRVDVNLWSTAPKPHEGDGASQPEPQAADIAQVVPVVADGASGHVGDVAIELSASHMSSPSATSASPNPPLGEAGRSQTREREAETCVICMDEIGDHVMMPCGHGGYCRNCAHKLFVRPPNLCPICRARLTSVVKVSLDTPIGTSSVAE